jgi:hypothetical protein
VKHSNILISNDVSKGNQENRAQCLLFVFVAAVSQAGEIWLRVWGLVINSYGRNPVKPFVEEKLGFCTEGVLKKAQCL